MTLDCGEHGRIELREAYEPRTFSGDWEVNGALVDGAVRDFNVIVDRAAASSVLETRMLTAVEAFACEPGTVCVVHVLEGALVGAEQGDTLVAEEPFELGPQGTARVAIARIAPVRGSPSA
jgi:environmental stress-induced protein Ves